MTEEGRTFPSQLVPAPVAVLVMAVVLAVMTAVLPGAVAQEAGEVGDVEAGRQVFANTCAACHGTSAEGRGDAPSLLGVYDRHTVDEVETTIRQGRGRMPAFDATLNDPQIEDVMAFLAAAPDAAEAGQRHGPHMDRWWDGMMSNGAGSGFMVVWLILGPLLVLLLVVGIVWVVRQVSSTGGPTDQQRPPAPGPPSGSAREDLDRRYARGEISREEYRAIRDDLEG